VNTDSWQLAGKSSPASLVANHGKRNQRNNQQAAFPAIPRIKKPDLDLAFHNDIKLVSRVPLSENNLTSIEFHLLDI
jgi:hypothetical protein